MASRGSATNLNINTEVSDLFRIFMFIIVVYIYIYVYGCAERLASKHIDKAQNTV